MEVYREQVGINQDNYLSLINLGIYLPNTSVFTIFQSFEVLPLLDFSHPTYLLILI